MQRILLLTLFLIPALFSHSQFEPEISQIYGGNSLDEAVDIEVNHTATAIFLGARTFSTDGDVPGNNGGSDYWIMKKDLENNLIWQQNFGGFNNDDIAAVMPHTDGGVLAFGTTRNEHGEFGDLEGLAGGWLIRTNSSGILVKGKTFGSDISENGIDAIRHANGNITMAIEASSPELDGQENHGILDAWIVQVDGNFNIKWTVLLGGSRQDSPAAIATDEDNNIYVAATSQSNLPGLDTNFGEKDLWVFKLDPFGELVWQKNFGGAADDEANDIVFDTSGHVYVLAHSYSNDGDFPSNRGFSDLWMIKLNAENGDPVFFKSYGGDGTDANGNIGRLGQNTFVISATTNSDSFDLSGNKGFNDVWVFTTDLDGNIKQEMNYGGSLNDLAGELIVVDSIIYLFNTSLSENKNVPLNSYTQQDLWLFTLDANPDPCSEQFQCIQDSTLSNELFPPATEVLVCAAGCTAGLDSGPDFIQGACPDFIHPTAYFKLTTDTTADLVTLSVASDEFNEPHIALLRSGNCTSFTQIACGQGTEGYVLLQFIDVEPLTTYIIAISDVAGNVGTFELCATSVDVEFCNEKDSIWVNATSMGSNYAGPFKPGEEVQICYELQDWNKLDCNGFQGLIPTFGPGWDPDGFDIFGMPIQIDTFLMPATDDGFWDWYKVGDVHYNITNPIAGYGGGQGMAPGWYFTNTGDPPPNDIPDQTTGDIDNCLPTSDKWKVCFTLPVEDDCETNMDISVSMRTFSDGELGINTSLACAYDQEETLIIGMVCCINPTTQNIAERSVCSGDTLIIIPETNILPPVTYSWTADPEPGIEGATSIDGVNYFYQTLHNETTETLDVVYTLWAEGINCEADPIQFIVHVYPKPTSRITITGPNIVCSGSPVTLNFENTGTPPYAIELTRDNQFFANILSETTNISIEIDPVLSGRFRVGSMRDAFCNGEGLGFVNVTVKPVGSTLIDTAICEGNSITIGPETFNEPGTYIITMEDAAANNCDSIVSLSLSVTPSITQTVDETICTGDTLFILGVPYTETTQTVIEYIGSLGCPDYIELDLLVIDTLVEETDQTICYGDTLNFEGVAVFQTGTYSHVEELMPGCFSQSVLNLTVLPQIFINDLSIIGDHGNGDGAILVEITGGSPPFSYQWSSGQTTESLFNIMQGSYTLTVTDRLACVEVFNFVVPMVTSTDGEIKHNEIKVWPTLLSTGNEIYIYFIPAVQQKISEVSWWDINGRQMAVAIPDAESVDHVTSVHVPSHMGSGMYFMRVATSHGEISWHKIIVE